MRLFHDPNRDAGPGLLGEKSTGGAHHDQVGPYVLGSVDDRLSRVVAFDQVHRRRPTSGGESGDRGIHHTLAALLQIFRGFRFRLLEAPGVVVEKRSALLLVERSQKRARNLHHCHHRHSPVHFGDEEVTESGNGGRRQDAGRGYEDVHAGQVRRGRPSRPMEAVLSSVPQWPDGRIER